MFQMLGQRSTFIRILKQKIVISYCFMSFTHFIQLIENIRAQISEAGSMKGVLDRIFRIAQYICVNAMLSLFYEIVEEKKRQSTDPVFFVNAH